MRREELVNGGLEWGIRGREKVWLCGVELAGCGNCEHAEEKPHLGPMGEYRR